MPEQEGSNINAKLYWEEFSKIIKFMEQAMNSEMSKERTAIYLEFLKEFSIEEIWAGVMEAIRGETYSQIPPVGKIIEKIEDKRREKQECWPQLEFKHEWPDTLPEKVREITKPFWDKLERMDKEEEERRRERWVKSKRNLQGQSNLVKLNADPAAKK